MGHVLREPVAGAQCRGSEGLPVDKCWSESVCSHLKCYSSFATPVIAPMRWATNAGAHFVVCAVSDSDGTVVFYDPRFGIVEVAGWQFPNCYTSDGSGAFRGFLVIPAVESAQAQRTLSFARRTPWHIHRTTD